MAKGDKRRLVVGAAILLVGAAALVAVRHHGDGSGAPKPAGGESSAPGWRGFAAGTPGVSGQAPAGGSAAPNAAAPSPEAIEEQITTAMNAWRNAILVKDEETVVTMDRVFLDMPARYTPALVKSARSEDNERVRAFSTRVLGKLKDAGLAPVFGELLDDKSPYVRQNAAWALGELGRTEGRQAAQRASADLRRLEQHDAAKDVRTAANTALKRLQ